MPNKTWKPTVGFAVVFALIAAGVFLAFKYSPALNGSLNDDQGEQPPHVGWKLFRSTAFYQLNETEDNQSIENVELLGPFPNEFENLQPVRYYKVTNGSVAPRGNLHFADGDLYENTLADRTTFTVEYTIRGYKMQIRTDNLYPGDVMGMEWVYWAPENTVLYDEPSENKVWAMYGYSPPSKRMSIHPHFELFYDDNHQKVGVNRQYLGVTWWEWWADVWVENAGWYLAPTMPL